MNLLFLTFSAKQLEKGRGKKLRDYNIQNLSTVMIALRLYGGHNPLQRIRIKKRELKPLPGFIKVTSKESEPCMITLDDDTRTKRAKMPCGHVICKYQTSM